MTGRLAVVFGGSGFVGRNVVRELARRGWRVRVAVRRPHHAQFLRPMGAVGQIQLAQANIRHLPSIEEALKDADAVVNLVGILHQSGEQSFARVQAGGAANLARIAAGKGIGTFVQISAIGADPESDSLYARTKGEAERVVREAIPTATIIRPSIVFGPEDSFFNKFAALLSLVPPFVPAPILIGGGGTKFQPVYVDDLADAICEALVRPEAAGRIYEIGGPQIYTFRELMELTVAEMRTTRILAPVPFQLAPLVGFLGEVAGLLPFLDPPITRDQARLLRRDNVVSAEPGVGRIEDLGIAPKALAAILPTYMVRFRKYGQFAEKAA